MYTTHTGLKKEEEERKRLEAEEEERRRQKEKEEEEERKRIEAEQEAERQRLEELEAEQKQKEKEEQEKKAKKKKKKKRRKKDDWSDDREWTGERIVKCIHAETSPMNWAVFKPSGTEVIPMAFGHGDLNDLRALSRMFFLKFTE